MMPMFLVLENTESAPEELPWRAEMEKNLAWGVESKGTRKAVAHAILITNYDYSRRCLNK